MLILIAILLGVLILCTRVGQLLAVYLLLLLGGAAAILTALWIHALERGTP